MAVYRKPPKKMSEAEAEVFEFRLEKDFQAYVKERIAKIPHIWYYHPADKMRGGIPDTILCVHGMFVAVELKVGDNTTSELQKEGLKKIRNCGGEEGVAYNWRQFKAVVDRAMCHHPYKLKIEWGYN
jgi:hypothetical protein